MTLNFAPPRTTELKPRILVIGVGGAGGNAVNNMIRTGLEGAEFLVANTDAQALAQSQAQRILQMGVGLTEGLGCGAKPEVGRQAAEEALDEILQHIEGTHMAFITAGMGGGTGTGAAPVIARACRDNNILTVGVVTKPFQFEGSHRMRIAEAGIEELASYVDTLIIIPNQNLFRLANEKTTFADAFGMADEVLHSGVRGITDLMVVPGLINLDFADVKTVMGEMGKAMMGTGEAEGDKRALEASEAAISNPLLDEVSMKGARGVLINISGGTDLTLFEVDEAANRIREEVDPEANIIVGSALDDQLNGRMRVSVVATGIDAEEQVERPPRGERRLYAVPDPALRTEPEAEPEPEPEAVEQVATAERDEAVASSAPEPAPQAMPVHAAVPQAKPLTPEPEPLPSAAPRSAQAEPAQASFVPREAMRPRVQPAMLHKPDPMREADAVNASGGTAPPRRRGLFHRMTALAQPEPEAQAPAARREPVARPSAKATPAAEAQPRLTLGAPEPSERLHNEGADTDIEIPSFLRRQAN